MNDLVSVIIPVYNTKNYLSKCIDSVLNQSYQNIEVLLVDDGSTDGSADICDRYKKDDARVQVWHREHAGVSSSRNFALQHSEGNWISFIDSDDWLDAEMYQALVNLALETEADTVCCGFWFGSYERQELSPVWDFINEDKYVLEKENTLNIIMSRSENLWNKLLSAKFAKQLTFDNTIRYGEDMLYLTEYLSVAGKAVITKQPYYFYRAQRQGNVVTAGLDNRKLDFYRATEEVINLLCKNANSYAAINCCVNTIKKVLRLVPFKKSYMNSEYVTGARALAYKVLPFENKALRDRRGIKQYAKRIMLILSRRSGALAVLYAKVYYYMGRNR